MFTPDFQIRTICVLLGQIHRTTPEPWPHRSASFSPTISQRRSKSQPPPHPSPLEYCLTHLSKAEGPHKACLCSLSLYCGAWSRLLWVTPHLLRSRFLLLCLGRSHHKCPCHLNRQCHTTGIKVEMEEAMSTTSGFGFFVLIGDKDLKNRIGWTARLDSSQEQRNQRLSVKHERISDWSA